MCGKERNVGVLLVFHSCVYLVKENLQQESGGEGVDVHRLLLSLSLFSRLVFHLPPSHRGYTHVWFTRSFVRGALAFHLCTAHLDTAEPLGQ